jgi:hypothetical protein
MSTSKKSKATALADVQALIAGTEKHTPSGQFTLGNVAYSTASLVQLLQSLADAMTAQNAAEAAAKQALATARDVDAKVGPTLRAYRKYLLASYGNATQTLADYGLVPAKAPKPLSVEAKSAKVALNKATRKARGTVGPKERLKVRGTVAATTGEPPVPPPAAPPKPTA